MADEMHECGGGKSTGLKSVITQPGVWRIRKTSSEIEVFRLEGEEGYGNILSPEFVQWREQLKSSATA
jgi:hypothetical protein